jgi:hypothetical protein
MTDYGKLDHAAECALVELQWLTGRTHQLRFLRAQAGRAHSRATTSGARMAFRWSRELSDRHICVRPTHLAGGRLTVRADLLPRMGSTRARLGFEALPPRAGAAGMMGENLPCAGAESW